MKYTNPHASNVLMLLNLQ